MGIERIVTAQGLLIGLAWENAFDVAVEKVGDGIPQFQEEEETETCHGNLHRGWPAARAVLYVGILCGFLAASYRNFIIPKIELLKEESKNATSKKKKET